MIPFRSVPDNLRLGAVRPPRPTSGQSRLLYIARNGMRPLETRTKNETAKEEGRRTDTACQVTGKSNTSELRSKRGNRPSFEVVPPLFIRHSAPFEDRACDSFRRVHDASDDGRVPWRDGGAHRGWETFARAPDTDARSKI